MTTPLEQTKATPALVSSHRDCAVVGAALAVGLVAFALLFQREIATAFYVWTHSDAYNHCFLVLPVAAYLAWDRRRELTSTTPRPAPWLALLAIPVAAAWFAADRLGIMVGRQLMAMTLLQIMVASVIGIRTWRTFAAPLLYLFFLVPFGDFLVPWLQGLVVSFATMGLNLFGIPNFSNGVTIEISQGTFLVHQACSGLRFLVASAAFGALYACVMFASPLRRALFIAASLAVAIIGNCFRVLGTILIAHFIGNAQAVETDHVLWGWLFYLIIGAVLILIGLLFRQERHPQLRENTSSSDHIAIGGSTIALAAVILLATTPRLAADYLNANGTSRTPAALIAMPRLPGCATVGIPANPAVPLVEDNIGVGTSRSEAYRCGDDVFVLTLRRYPPRIGARPLFLSLRRVTEPPGSDIILETDEARFGTGQEAPLWRVTEADIDGHYTAIAAALWIGGRPSGAGIPARFYQALNTVRRSAISPVLAVVTHFGRGSPDNARRAIDAFLSRTAPLSKAVSKWLSAS